MNIAFFDFDGTLIKKDSFILFVEYISSKKKYYIGWLVIVYYYLLSKLGFISSQGFKEEVISYFMKGREVSELNTYAINFAENVIPKKLTNQAIQQLRYHKDAEDKIVIVSASLDLWLQNWCKTRGFDLVCSIAEVKDDRITGKLVGRNCIGVEKVSRIKKAYKLEEYSKIYVYGDSENDRPMLSLGTDAFYNWEKVI